MTEPIDTNDYSPAHIEEPERGGFMGLIDLMNQPPAGTDADAYDRGGGCCITYPEPTDGLVE